MISTFTAAVRIALASTVGETGIWRTVPVMSVRWAIPENSTENWDKNQTRAAIRPTVLKIQTNGSGVDLTSLVEEMHIYTQHCLPVSR